LLGQLVLFLVSGLVWQGWADARQALPPLDRAVAAWSLVWIVWLWGFPSPTRLANILIGMFTLIILTFLIFTLIAWGTQDRTLAFNATWFDLGWSILSIFIILAGILIVALEHPKGWEIGIGILALNLAGYTLHIFRIQPAGDYAATIRLAQLCSYPLLPSLVASLKPVITPQPSDTLLPLTTEQLSYPPSHDIIQTWLKVIEQKDPIAVCSVMTRAIAQTIPADLCFFLTPPSQSGRMIVECGWDNHRSRELGGQRLEKSSLPALAEAAECGLPLRLDTSHRPGDDLSALAAAFGLDRSGNLLSVPVGSPEHCLGSIVLMSPFSNHAWTTEDHAFLWSIAGSLHSSLLNLQAAAGAQQVEPDRILKAELEQAQQQIHRLRVEKTELAAALEQASLNTAAYPFSGAIENDKLPLATLQKDGELDHFSSELRLALEELAHLQNALATANMQIQTLEAQAHQPGAPYVNNLETLATTIQELRQPITSIVGYTDLLMSESVGILGALQRKFLDRIHVATDRLHNLADTLTHSLTHKQSSAAAPSVNIASALDQAVLEAGSRLSEKKITLQIDAPLEVPNLQGDQDALEQIFLHLIHTACGISPPAGEITLKLSATDTGETPCVLLQMSHTKGGVAVDDLRRVLSKHFRTGSALDASLGDAGISLPLVRALTEAAGGRIWVDSHPGEVTTISVLLPIHPHPQYTETP
ncbi:MAG: ATP-binding protein, partial [Anaerolineaceae bacterium]|nr:ATP-binding protein [Anaerolineaceae bacterium]